MRKCDISILLAGVFWGVIGLFTRRLSALGMTSAGVLLVRSGGCAVLFAAAALIKGPALLKIRWKDAWLFVFFGAVTFFFTYCYYQSIDLGSLSAACTLMYSAPVFVMVLSLFVFGERFSARKLTALLCAVVGCCFVSGVLEGDSPLSMAGVIYGLLAGIGYAVYSVCIKALSNRAYDSLTINACGWILCSVLGFLVWGGEPAAPAVTGTENILLSAGLIVISGFLPALLYSAGLRGEEAGKGAVMASVEPVVASLAGFIAFGEAPSFLGAVGIILVLAAVAILNLRGREDQASSGRK